MKVFLVSVFIVLLSVPSFEAKPALFGPGCWNLVNCFVDPCQVSRCDAYPSATCAANYCGGCNAIWSVNGKTIDCSATPTIETKCVTVNCFVDPCGMAKCHKHPTARCRANYCGGCHAWFYNAQNQRVQCD